MTKIITCCELRYLMHAWRNSRLCSGHFRSRSRARRARLARAQGFARQPRKRPPRHGGAPYPAAEAVSAGVSVSAGSRGHVRGFQRVKGHGAFRSGLKLYVFKLLAARVTVEI